MTVATSSLPQTEAVLGQCRAWYGAFGRAVYRFVRFHVDSADTADDITADVFLRVLEGGSAYDPERGEARAWIFSIARNALRDHFRRLRVRRQVNVSALRDIAADAPSAEERLLRQEEVGRLLQTVQRLRPADRDLLALRYGSELTVPQIGEVLGLRENAVRTRLCRAVSRLRAELIEAED